jgi:hypothetical protein
MKILKNEPITIHLTAIWGNTGFQQFVNKLSDGELYVKVNYPNNTEDVQVGSYLTNFNEYDGIYAGITTNKVVLHLTPNYSKDSFTLTFDLSDINVTIQPIFIEVVDPNNKETISQNTDIVKKIQTPEATVELHDPMTIIKSRERQQAIKPRFCDSHVCITNPIF